MKSLLRIFAVSIILCGCENGNDINEPGEEKQTLVCNTTDPVEELPWLKKLIQEEPEREGLCEVYNVVQGNYKGEIVFIIDVSGALCCTCAGPAVYNCKGELVASCDLGISDEVKDSRVVWTRTVTE